MKQYSDKLLDIAYSVNQTRDGGYIIAGRTYALTAGFSDFWLIKVDNNGHEQWNRRLGGKFYDMAFTAMQTSDGSFVIAGGTDSYGAGSVDALLFKTDSNGNEVWNRTFGGKNLDEVYSIEEADNGGYVLAGKTGSYGAGYIDAWLIMVDPEGNEVWTVRSAASKRTMLMPMSHIVFKKQRTEVISSQAKPALMVRDILMPGS